MAGRAVDRALGRMVYWEWKIWKNKKKEGPGMKKPVCAALALVLALCLGCFFAMAEEEAREIFTSGKYKYALLDDGSAEITQYTGTGEELILPASLDGHAVTAIGEEAFFSCTSLTGVILPDSVTAIGDEAFSLCTSLTSVSIPDSVTEIGSNPFLFCAALTKIDISPDHPALAAIDGVLFSKADKRLICYPCAIPASAYAIPQGILLIGDGAFGLCSSLTSVTIPDSVTAIGDSAFALCGSLTGLTIPDSVTAIGDYAFEGCKSLTSMTIPGSVTAIGMGTFYQCYGLSSVILPGSVTAIGDFAFADCPKLILTVGRDRYARQYCIDNGLDYLYHDVNNTWLYN